MSAPTFFAHAVLHAGSKVTEAAGRHITQAVSMLAGNEVPPPEALFHLGITGMIDERSMQEALLNHGISLTVAGDPQTGNAIGARSWIQEIWNQHYFAQQELPGPTESFVLTNRGLFTESNLDRILERQGYSDPRIRAALANLRYEIPGSSDLVRFSVRHVFEPDLIERLGYNDEFRPILDFWHRLQGLNYPLFSGPFQQQIAEFERARGLQPGAFLESYAARGLEDPTWAQAFWWSHWVVPSASQAYEMFFRYRIGRNHAFDPPGTSGINFGPDDLDLLLRANDYPPKLRPLLAGIAHRIPGIRFLRQLRATEVFTQADVKELLLRQGYSAGDATVLAESVERNDAAQRRKQIESQAKGQFAKYWELGIIDESRYQTALVQHGLTANDARDTVELAKLDLESKRVTKIIDFVRKQYLRGVLDQDQTLAQLLQVGIVQPRAGLYVEDWTREIQVQFKQISAQKAVKWACEGFISVDQLRNRLQNLGYNREDQNGLVAEAAVCSATRVTRAAAQQERDRRQTVRELQQQQRAAAQAILAARRQLASHGTPAQLRKWFCAGHVGSDELYTRLRSLGWPDVDISRLIADCKSSTGGGQGGKRGGSVLGSGPGVPGT